MNKVLKALTVLLVFSLCIVACKKPKQVVPPPPFAYSVQGTSVAFDSVSCFLSNGTVSGMGIKSLSVDVFGPGNNVLHLDLVDLQNKVKEPFITPKTYYSYNPLRYSSGGFKDGVNGIYYAPNASISFARIEVNRDSTNQFIVTGCDSINYLISGTFNLVLRDTSTHLPVTVTGTLTNQTFVPRGF